MTSKMIVRIDSQVKQRFNNLARREGKSASQMVRELIEGYIKENDIGTYIDDLWCRIGDDLQSKGTKHQDVNEVISAVRKEKR